MKRHLIAACAVVMACVANAAATYNWGIESYIENYSTKDSSPSTANAGWYTCYALEQGTARSLLGMSTAVTYNDVATWLGADFSTRLDEVVAAAQAPLTASSWDSNFDQYYFLHQTGATEASLSDAVGVFVFDDGNGIAAFGVAANNPKLAVSFKFDSDTKYGYGWSGWQAVPEPTSGLLLLIGLAGLALKRKRA